MTESAHPSACHWVRDRHGPPGLPPKHKQIDQHSKQDVSSKMHQTNTWQTVRLKYKQVNICNKQNCQKKHKITEIN